MDQAKSNNSSDEKFVQVERRIGRMFQVAMLFAGALVLFYAAFFFKQTGGGLSVSSEHWGQAGDFIGGVINPFVAFFTLYIVSKAYLVQKRELSEVRAEMENASTIQVAGLAMQTLKADFELHKAQYERASAQILHARNELGTRTLNRNQVVELHDEIGRCETVITNTSEQMVKVNQAMSFLTRSLVGPDQKLSKEVSEFLEDVGKQ